MHVTFEPLFGLASLTEYDFTPVDGAEGLYRLRSLEDPGIRLFLLDAARYLPGYRPALPPQHAAARLLVVATPGAGGTTVNLLAPILIDEQAATGRQIVVDGDVIDVRAPLSAGGREHVNGAPEPVVTSSRR